MRAVELTRYVACGGAPHKEYPITINPLQMTSWAKDPLSCTSYIRMVGDNVELLPVAETPEEITRRWEAAMNDAMGGETS